MNSKLLLQSLVTLGSTLSCNAALTWVFKGTAPADKLAAITSAMNTAVANFNLYADYSGSITVTYNAAVPTAQGGYQSQIDFGGSISPTVAQHEMAHWLGVGTYWTWNNLRSNNLWTGQNALARLSTYDGAGAVLHADGAHFWPYGWNQPNEGPAERHIGMVGAIRKDMGLSDTTIRYRLLNRASGKYLDNLNSLANGANVTLWENTGNRGQYWFNLTNADGYLKLWTDGNGGRFLDTLDNVNDLTPVGQWENGSSYNQQWKIIPVDAGYFRLSNRGNGKCLDSGNVNTVNGAVLVSYKCTGNKNQHWIVVP